MRAALERELQHHQDEIGDADDHVEEVDREGDVEDKIEEVEVEVRRVVQVVQVVPAVVVSVSRLRPGDRVVDV
jgi:hypothetical protein